MQYSTHDSKRVSKAFEPSETGGGPVAGASAPATGLPCLKKHNCTKTGSYRSSYVAEENIRLYIKKVGENNIGLLTVTMASECRNSAMFQTKWHSWRTHFVTRLFPTGMWIRERQPRTGNWHAHCVVDVGFDLRTGFPFDQVASGFYANVDPRLRRYWKDIRESAVKHGFGRTELLPIKASGASCARYLVKYLTKIRGSEKSGGEEKCRLFSIWGGVRFVFAPFSFVSSRIIRKRKEWLAAELGAECYGDFGVMFGAHWWFHLGPALMDVIMPVEYYQIPRDGELVWDDLGFKAYSEDITKFQTESLESAIMHSRYRLFWEVGKQMYGADSGQVRDFALHKIGERPEKVPEIDPQLFLQFPAKPKEED